jgi:hypothetical protein
MKNSKGIQAKSADTLIVENRLRTTEPGDVVTYAELSSLLGRDVREFCLGCVQTARKALIHESVFFDTISNEGYMRLTDDEACKASSHYVDRARSASRRGLTHLQNVQFEKLTDECKRQHLTTSAQLGAIQLFSTGKAGKKISQAVDTANSRQMAIGETLKLFGG